MKNWITRNLDPILMTLVLFIFAICFLSRDSKERVLIDKPNVTKTYNLPDGTKVATSNTKEVTKKELKTLIKSQNKPKKDLIKQFSEVKNITETVTETVIDTVKFTPKDTIPYKFQYSGTVIKENYSLNYNVDQKGVTLSNFILIDTTTTVSGTKRTWLFGKKTEVKDVMHSNENTTTTKIDDVSIKEKRPWYISNVAIIIYTAIGIKAASTLIK